VQRAEGGGTSSTNADRLNLTYNYDAVGNVQSISDDGILSSFGYDGLYQLIAAYGQSFSYDTAGGIVNFNGLAYTPDSAHPHAVNLGNGADRYDYDLNGNQVVRNKGVANQEQVLVWDVENRLSAVTYTNRTASGGGGGPPATCNGVPCKRVFLPLVMQQAPAERYSYDADGARVRKETKTEGTTLYIGAHYEVRPLPTSPPPPPPSSLPKRAWLPLIANNYLTVDGQPAQIVKYYLVGGQRSASRTGSPGPVTYYYHDQLGSTVASSSGGESTRYWHTAPRVMGVWAARPIVSCARARHPCITPAPQQTPPPTQSTNKNSRHETSAGRAAWTDRAPTQPPVPTTLPCSRPPAPGRPGPGQTQTPAPTR
jgi:YD repeat-containing protein